MGKIVNGKYYSEDSTLDIPEVSGGYEESRRDYGRAKYRKDIIQARVGGELNRDFFLAYPNKIKDYGLTQDDISKLSL